MEAGTTMIVEIQCLPNPAGTPENRYAHVEAAIAVLRSSGLTVEVGPLGTSVEGEPDVLPAPSRVATALWDTRDVLQGHIVTTVTETALGVLLGAALGVTLAILVASSGLARRTVEPLLVASQTIPLIVLAPLLVLWFGFGMTPKVVVVVLIVFFPVAISTASGLASADSEQLDLVRSLGAGRLQELRLVRVPAALPSLFSGLRISSTYAVAGATLGVLIGGRAGL